MINAYKAKINSDLLLLILAIGSICLGILDGSMTIFGISMGYAREANPLMNMLLSINPILFFSFKAFVHACAGFLFWQHRELFVAKLGLWSCFTIYFLVSIWHAYGLSFL